MILVARIIDRKEKMLDNSAYIAIVIWILSTIALLTVKKVAEKDRAEK